MTKLNEFLYGVKILTIQADISLRNLSRTFFSGSIEVSAAAVVVLGAGRGAGILDVSASAVSGSRLTFSVFFARNLSCSARSWISRRSSSRI